MGFSGLGTVEPPVITRKSVISRQEYWKKLPAVLSGDKNFQRFIISQRSSTWRHGLGFHWLFMPLVSGGYRMVRWEDIRLPMLVGQAGANLLLDWLPTGRVISW